jgi:hypothetical protein
MQKIKTVSDLIKELSKYDHSRSVSVFCNTCGRGSNCINRLEDTGFSIKITVN